MQHVTQAEHVQHLIRNLNKVIKNSDRPLAMEKTCSSAPTELAVCIVRIRLEGGRTVPCSVGECHDSRHHLAKLLNMSTPH